MSKLSVVLRASTGAARPNLRVRVKNVDTDAYVLDTDDDTLVDNGDGSYTSATDVSAMVYSVYTGDTATLVNGYEERFHPGEGEELDQKITATEVTFTPSTAPTSSEGKVYYDETDGAVKVYNGSVWERISNDGAINVEDYGAVGDGVTDDKDAIQSALNAAAGGILAFQNKTYAISGKITIPANTYINGNGAVILLTGETSEYEGVIDNYGGAGSRDNITIVNLTINGNGYVAETGGSFKFGTCNNLSLIGCKGIEAGFYIVDCSRVTVQDWVGDNSGGSIGAEGADIRDINVSNFTMTSDVVTDRGPSLLVRAFNGYSIDDVTINSVRSKGCRKAPLKVSIPAAETGSISNVTINSVVATDWSKGSGSGYDASAIEIFGQSGSPLRKITVNGATIKAGGNAGEHNCVSMSNVEEFAINGVCGEGVERAGVLIDSCSGGAISGCFFTGCGTDNAAVYCGGIYIYQSTDISVVGNVAVDSANSYNGITVNTCGSSLVSGNIVKGNGGYGIRETGINSAANTYGLNQTDGNTAGGALIGGTSATSYIGPRVLKFANSVTGGMVAAGEMVTGNLTTSATGAVTGDRVVMTPSASPGSGFTWSAHVYSDGRINYVIANSDGSSSHFLSTVTWTAYVFKE
jgi:hypothetical protein